MLSFSFVRAAALDGGGLAEGVVVGVVRLDRAGGGSVAGASRRLVGLRYAPGVASDGPGARLVMRWASGERFDRVRPFECGFDSSAKVCLKA
ncbi:MAG: hypothetical protein QXE91_09270 [Thermofilaceae archaeon]